MVDYYKINSDEALKQLSSSLDGLTNEEAKSRLEKYGKNQIVLKTDISIFKLLLEQFNDFVIWILLGAVIISGVSGEYVDMVVILVILILNAVIGFIQEYKAEKSIEALQGLVSLQCNVLRSGTPTNIDASELVPGDLILLEPGEKVPADARLVEAHDLATQEGALTGESTSVDKQTNKILADAGVADRNNLVFSGTIVVRGAAKAVVYGTGMDTEIGKIAHLIHSSKSPLTPLQNKLDHFGKVLGIGVIIIAIIVFLAGIWRGEGKLSMLITAVSLAVAAVPEGLPAVVTVTLAIGVKRMLKRNALIRKLPSVETLGSTTVICTDKTGTLTHNQMTVKKIWVDNEIINVEGSGYDPYGDFSTTTSSLSQLLKIGVLCNNASLGKTLGKKQEEIVGDPTEIALLVSGAKLKLSKEMLEKTTPRIDIIDFDSQRKIMSTIHKLGKTKFMMTKGAPEEILKRSNRILINGNIAVLNNAKKQEILSIIEKLGKEALRVLGFGYKEITTSQSERSESSFIFVGLQGMIDPPRKETISAIERCKSAGIKVIMITGDHRITAAAIANKLGIEGKVMIGEELDKLNHKQLAKIIDQIGVFARVSPEHKMIIIDALQHKGEVVAMTGDGVNDAPAIKKADIGVAMGKSGTDVAKEASSMILVDDNFTSIVDAVEEGRTVYSNIQKFIEYLISCNAGEVLTILVASLLGLPLPLIAVQILLMNLLTDGLAALSLAMEEKEPGVMERPPRKKNARIVDLNGLIQIIVVGVIMAAGTLGVFLFSNPDENLRYAHTMAFTTLVLFQLFHVFNSRSLNLSLFKLGALGNRWVVGAVGVSLILQILIIYTPLNILFRTAPISIFDWGIILLVSSSVFIIRELWKIFESERV